MVQDHPSGDPTASRDVLDVTREITAALATLDIAVHDDAVVARNVDQSSPKGRGLARHPGSDLGEWSVRYGLR